MKEICHQYDIRLKLREEDLKNLSFDPLLLKISEFNFKGEELNGEIISFIKKYEWLGTIGVNPKWVFTARYKSTLAGVVLINEPVAFSKLLGEETKELEALIQRGACASWTPKNLGSSLIMFSCRWMVKNTKKRCFVAYSDSSAGEIGTIYQACNFDYLGNNFGVKYKYLHPSFKNSAWFSDQTLKRTSTLKKWLKDSCIISTEDWFKKNGFKDLKNIPKDIQEKWKLWQNKILKESIKIPQISKGKYVLVLGTSKKDQKKLNSLKNYTPKEYPKRKD